MGDAPAVGRLSSLDLDALDEGTREIVALVVGGRGRLPTPFRVWLASPALAGQLAPLGQFLANGTSLTAAEVELVILIAARHVHARYVTVAHTRQAVEAGLGESVVAAIGEGRKPDVADPRERALIEMMQALVGPDDPSEEVFGTAVEALGHAGVAEAITLAGYFTAVGLAMKMYAVPPPSGPPQT